MSEVKLSEPQYRALKRYEDGIPHNEVALRIREDIFRRLSDSRMIRRTMFLQSVITEEGRAAIKSFEARDAKKKSRKG